MPRFPIIDARTHDLITDEQARFFRENGLLHIRGLLRGEELRCLRDETLPLCRRAIEERPDDPDYFYAEHELTGERVPFRIEYVIDKTRAGKALLGHPFVLRSIEKLQGPSFIPTWDAMVFKNEGMGKAIPWHRDAAPYEADVDRDVAAINVDFYLDGSDLTNCLWGILGSNRWDTERAGETIRRLNDAPGRFSTDADCVPIPVEPGDVLFHNVLVLHGSPAAQSKLRRVIYYEFRPIEVELAHGPHSPGYIPLKQRVLLACLRRRRQASYARGETPFEYEPAAAYASPSLAGDEEPESYRYPHGRYWRQPA